MIRQFLEHHRWFMKASCDFLGYDSFRRASGWPLIRAWCRFMWLSRRDILKSKTRALTLCLCLLSTPAWAQERAPWWATSLAVAGPIADGLSTQAALKQPGIVEANPFFSGWSGNEILAFKVAQGAAMGYVVHRIGTRSRKAAIGTALVMTAVNVTVTSLNVRTLRRQRSR
jgi:hypothetical protein